MYSDATERKTEPEFNKQTKPGNACQNGNACPYFSCLSEGVQCTERAGDSVPRPLGFIAILPSHVIFEKHNARPRSEM